MTLLVIELKVGHRATVLPDARPRSIRMVCEPRFAIRGSRFTVLRYPIPVPCLPDLGVRVPGFEHLPRRDPIYVIHDSYTFLPCLQVLVVDHLHPVISIPTYPGTRGLSSRYPCSSGFGIRGSRIYRDVTVTSIFSATCSSSLHTSRNFNTDVPRSPCFAFPVPVLL